MHSLCLIHRSLEPTCCIYMPSTNLFGSIPDPIQDQLLHCGWRDGAEVLHDVQFRQFESVSIE
eukprot:5619071-Amphidinium_carterae.1